MEPNVFQSIANTNDKLNEKKTETPRNKSNSPRPLLTPLNVNDEQKIPKENDFINDYFNQKIRKIHDEYIDVQNSFQSNLKDNKIVEKYEDFEKFKGNEDNEDNKVIEDNKKGNIKKNKSPGWQYTFKNMDFDKLQYSYIVDEQLVTRVKHNEDENNENNEDNSVYRIIKEFVFNKTHNATLFMMSENE